MLPHPFLEEALHIFLLSPSQEGGKPQRLALLDLFLKYALVLESYNQFNHCPDEDVEHFYHSRKSPFSCPLQCQHPFPLLDLYHHGLVLPSFKILYTWNHVVCTLL